MLLLLQIYAQEPNISTAYPPAQARYSHRRRCASNESFALDQPLHRRTGNLGFQISTGGSDGSATRILQNIYPSKRVPFFAIPLPLSIPQCIVVAISFAKYALDIRRRFDLPGPVWIDNRSATATKSNQAVKAAGRDCTLFKGRVSIFHYPLCRDWELLEQPSK